MGCIRWDDSGMNRFSSEHRCCRVRSSGCGQTGVLSHNKPVVDIVFSAVEFDKCGKSSSPSLNVQGHRIMV